MPPQEFHGPLPTAHLIVKPRANGEPDWFVKWRHRNPDGTTTQVKRRIGLAWVTREAPSGQWVKRRGRVPATHLDRAAAHVRAAEIVARTEGELATARDAERRERERPATFREVANGYLRFVEHDKGVKPWTVVGYRYALAEPGTKHARGGGAAVGLVMTRLGDRPAVDITTRDIEDLLAERASLLKPTGKPVSARTVNRDRQLLSAIFNWATRTSTYGLPHNPVTESTKRREPMQARSGDYSVEEVEALARAVTAGLHRVPRAHEVADPAEDVARAAADARDGEAVRLAAFTGLRLAELVALQWQDVDFDRRKIHVRRSVSNGVETSPKSGKSREVPMPAPVVGALDRLARRPMFTGSDDYVLCGRAGGRLEASALSRRVRRAMEPAGLRQVRFHDLRHTYGSLLVHAGVDLVTVKAAMGHAKIETTERYLHARDATELADRFTIAFSPDLASSGKLDAASRER